MLVALATGACGSARRQPFTLGEAPWGDGEISRYDVLGRGGAVVGTASWTWSRNGDGWREVYDRDQAGKSEHTAVEMDGHLRPLSARTEHDGTKVETTYGSATITSRTTAPEAPGADRSLATPPDAVDNEASLQVQRALPFAAGYATRYTDVVSKSAVLAPMDVAVVGEESIATPAGTFASWHVSMGAGAHDAWYAKDAPRLLVKYTNNRGGSTFVLRSWQASERGERHGSLDPAPAPPPDRGSPPLNATLVVVSAVVQLPMMIALPLLLGAFLKRRYGSPWSLWRAGAITFVLSQVVHIPLNWAIGAGLGQPLASFPLPLFALGAGLTAGLCEEVARYLMLRYRLKEARSFRDALQFGAGHGGIEAILFGVLAACSLVAMLALRSIPPSRLGIAGETASQLAAAMDMFWASPSYTPILAGLERVFAMTAHVALSVMVMRAVTRRRPAWLVAAIAAHTALDGFAVWGMSRLGPLGTEAGVGLAALLFAGVIWALRADDAKPIHAILRE